MHSNITGKLLILVSCFFGCLAQDPITVSAALEVLPEKTRCYCGEKVNYRIKFYYKDDSIALQAIQSLAVSALKIISPEGPVSGHAQKNGQDYHVLEWQGRFYPQEAGTCVIPALRCQYLQTKKNNNYNALIFQFFATQEQKYCFSPAVTMVIEALPAYPKPVQAVGQFTDFTVAAKSLKISAGQAFELSVTIIGTGNISELRAPPLNIPDVFNIYESKSELPSPDTRIFTYIVHALEPGTWEIPVQEFIYFDTEIQKYKKLTTEPVQIVVEKVVSTSVAEVPAELPVIQAPKIINPVTYSGFYNYFIFGGLFLLLLLVMVSPLRIYYMRWRYNKKVRAVIHHETNIRVLYECLRNFFKDYTCPEQELNEWQKFWSLLHESHFSPHQEPVSNELRLDAKKWIEKCTSVSFFDNLRSVRAITGLLIMGIVVMYGYHVMHDHRAIIAAPCELKLGPGIDYATGIMLQHLDDVKILAERDSWCLVKHGEQRGWVQTHNIMEKD